MSAAPIRIGDQERDRAVECLREHMAAGRLDAAEFDDRLTIALSARYAADLSPLFADLPLPHPAGLFPATGADAAPAARAAADPAAAVELARAARRRAAGRNALIVMVWSTGVTLCVALGWNLWWLLFIPLAIGFGARRSCGGPGRAVRRRENLRGPELPGR